MLNAASLVERSYGVKHACFERPQQGPDAIPADLRRRHGITPGRDGYPDRTSPDCLPRLLRLLIDFSANFPPMTVPVRFYG